METKANHVLIGAFVLAMSFMGFGFLYWIADWGTGSQGKHYHILFTGDVSGLTSASSVLFNGLKVGTVRKLKIYKPDSRKVLVVIHVNANVPIRENSRARISSQALTGFAAVRLTAGTPDSPILPNVAQSPYPVIKADAATSKDIVQALPEVLANANALLVRLNDVVAHNEDGVRASVKNVETMTKNVNTIIEDNKAAIAGTVKSLESFATMLDQQKGDISTIIANTKDLSGRFNTIADKLETAVDGFNSYMASDSSSLIGQAKEAVQYFRELGRKLDASLGEGAADIMHLSRKALKDIGPMIKGAQDTFKKLERVASELERNPQAFLLGKNTKGSDYNRPGN